VLHAAHSEEQLQQADKPSVRHASRQCSLIQDLFLPHPPACCRLTQVSGTADSSTFCLEVRGRTRNNARGLGPGAYLPGTQQQQASPSHY
jgi:hypothetical protein